MASPSGIDCGSTCFADYASGSIVTLSANPDAGSIFTGWSGAGCSGTGLCALTMDAAKAVTATFELAGPQGFDFFAVTPCRVLDTRPAAALVSQVLRMIPVAELCGVPVTAKAVALNVTVVSPSGAGYVSLACRSSLATDQRDHFCSGTDPRQ